MGAQPTTTSFTVVDMAGYVPDFAIDTRNRHVPALVGATSLPVLIVHLPEVTRYVRFPLDGDVTMRESSVRLFTFTDCSFTVNPAVAENVKDEPATDPMTLRAVIVNE